jgi:RNA-directed DNA polymerase
MRLEHRGRVKQLYSEFNWQQEETGEYNKTVYHLQATGVHGLQGCQANAGAAGVDKQSIEDFEKDLKDNLYKIWNRMRWNVPP